MKFNANIDVLGRAKLRKHPFQENVLDIQTDATLDPGASPATGARYILTASASLHANFGSISGVGDNDIVEYNGSAFEVVWDASVNGEGAKCWDEDSNGFYSYNGTAWSSDASAGDLASLSDTDISGPASGELLIYDGTNSWDNVAMSGDVTIDNTGAATIGSGVVENDMLAGSIADGKLASDYVQTSEVDDTSIEFAGGTLNVKALGVTDAMLAGSISDGKLASDYIQTSEVDDSSIEFAGGNLNVKALGITDAMLAGSISFTKLADSANIARLDQAETVAAVWAFGANLPTASADPTSANQLARKSYVDSVISGLDFQADVLNTQTDATLDPGASPTTGDRYILTNTAALHANFGSITGVGDNDIVEYTGSAFEVAYDVSTEGEGALAWDQNANHFKLYDGSTWSEFGGLSGVTAGDALSKSGNTLNVNVDDSSIEVATDALQVKALGITNAMLAGSIADGKLASDYVQTSEVDDSTIEWTGSALQVKDAGITAAKLASGALQRYSALIGGSTAVAVNHALGLTTASACHITMFEVATGEQVLCDSFTFTDGNNLTVNFVTAPGASSIRINITSAE